VVEAGPRGAAGVSKGVVQPHDGGALENCDDGRRPPSLAPEPDFAATVSTPLQSARGRQPARGRGRGCLFRRAPRRHHRLGQERVYFEADAGPRWRTGRQVLILLTRSAHTRVIDRFTDTLGARRRSGTRRWRGMRERVWRGCQRRQRQVVCGPARRVCRFGNSA